MDIVVEKLNFYINMIYIHTIWTDLKFPWLVKIILIDMYIYKIIYVLLSNNVNHLLYTNKEQI